MISVTRKRSIAIIFLSFEFFLMMYVYFFGWYGFFQLVSLRNVVERLQNEVDIQKRDIFTLQDQIDKWNSISFYKEKVAREQLGMARKGEIIYKIG